jgi:hypothetical protein
MLSHSSFTVSVAEKSLKSWIKQKRRHLTAAAYYKKNDKVRLFMEPFSRVSYYGLLVALLIMLVSWPVVAFIAIVRLVMRAVILRKASATFNEPRLWFISLFFDILAPCITGFLYLTTNRRAKGRKTWK